MSNQTLQVISRDGVVICVTSVPYPEWIVKDMKRNGYKVVTVDEQFAKLTVPFMRERSVNYEG